MSMPFRTLFPLAWRSLLRFAVIAADFGRLGLDALVVEAFTVSSVLVNPLIEGREDF